MGWVLPFAIGMAAGFVLAVFVLGLAAAMRRPYPPLPSDHGHSAPPGDRGKGETP